MKLAFSTVACMGAPWQKVLYACSAVIGLGVVFGFYKWFKSGKKAA